MSVNNFNGIFNVPRYYGEGALNIAMMMQLSECHFQKKYHNSDGNHFPPSDLSCRWF